MRELSPVSLVSDESVPDASFVPCPPADVRDAANDAPARTLSSSPGTASMPI